MENNKLRSKTVTEAITDIFQSDEVKTALKNAVCEAAKAQMDELSRISFLERQKAVQKNAFTSTEKLLYSYHALKQHLANEREYLDMAFKKSSGSVVRYQKNKPEKQEDDQLLADRMSSYKRSLHDYERLSLAIDAVASKKGFEIIKLKYLTDDDYTYAEIAEKLSGTNGFSANLSEKTVRRYKNNLVNEIALFLFGTDAI